MLQQDFSQIILTDDEKHIFRKFKHSDKVTLHRDEWNILAHTNLIKHHLGGKSDWFDDMPEQGICELSEKGIRYREYQKQQSDLIHKETRHFWIPIIIANAIALAGLVVAIIK